MHTFVTMHTFLLVVSAVLVAEVYSAPTMQNNAGKTAFIIAKRDTEKANLLMDYTDDGKEDEDDDQEEEHQNPLVTHILDQIHKGHVTQDQMRHWWFEINNALAHGRMTREEYDFMMNVLKSSASGSHVIPHTCCDFGK
ncbi:hypothetical protein DPMN_156303 [Dreissena polymorpha]|uniref:RxLR effector protein n=1 Tax=Dreissena polymorpha TaxID=45954 RepID=A0A9D4J8P2_DREPO|nr:hypothetical protein DPMN_156303 [Dreissena polymorpha]